MAEDKPVVVTAPQGAPGGPQHDPRMSFFEHLGELRKRLVWSIIVFSVASAICFSYSEPIFEFLRMPLAAAKVDQKMIVLGPLDMFITYIKLSLMSGLCLSAPFILTQLWLFISPGLYPHEKRLVVPFVVLGTASFVGGAAFCFYLVLPASFKYLIEMVPATVEAQYSVATYMSLIIHLMLAFGAVFELPLIMSILGAVGIVTAQAFAKFRRYWIVIAFVIGGVLTPTPDPMTQLMMATPLIVFFEIGIIGARLLQGRRGRSKPA